MGPEEKKRDKKCHSTVPFKWLQLRLNPTLFALHFEKDVSTLQYAIRQGCCCMKPEKKTLLK